MSTMLSTLAAVIGAVLVVVAGLYLFTPANALPSFMPGYDPSLAKIHLKHGIGSLVLGVALLAYAWPSGQRRSRTPRRSS